jgi:hypothetical protein
MVFIIIMIIISHHTFPFPWYFFSWTSGAPHHSDFKFHTVALSLLRAMMSLVQLPFVQNQFNDFMVLFTDLFSPSVTIPVAPMITVSRDSSVSTALGSGLDDRGSMVRFPAGAGNFSLHHRVQNGYGAYPASYQWVPEALSVGVKRPGREADHSPPSSAEVKGWVELYLHSPIRLHGVVLS